MFNLSNKINTIKINGSIPIVKGENNITNFLLYRGYRRIHDPQNSVSIFDCGHNGNNFYLTYESSYQFYNTIKSIDLPNCVSFTKISMITSVNTEVMDYISLPKCTTFNGSVIAKSVYLPLVTAGPYGVNFKFLNGCEDIYAPNVSRLESTTFYGVKTLNSVTLSYPLLSIGYSCFTSAKFVSEELNNDLVASNCYIGSYAFRSCINLKKINGSFKINAGSVFYTCTKISYVNMTGGILSGSANFVDCAVLKCVKLSNVSGNIGSNTFVGCYQLKYTDVGNSISSISTNAFSNCLLLEHFVIRNESSIVRLTNSSVFYGTPLASSTTLGRFGSIYVPASLVDSYKAYTTWTYFKDRITSIDNLPSLSEIFGHTDFDD